MPPLINPRLSSLPLALRAGVMCLGALVTGCLSMAAPEESPRVRMNLSVERPSAGHQPLKAMVITFVSGKGDTLRDTITDEGARLAGPHIVLNPPADQGQVLTPRYELPHDRGHWSCAIESVDAHDTLIHHSTCDIGALAPGEIRDVALRLPARVASYEAVFHPRAATPDGAKIALARFELDVDGVTHCAASLQNAAPAAPVTVGCTYLPAGPRDVATRVYGRVGDEAGERLLWSGRSPVEIKAGSGRTVPLALTWEAPDAPARSLGKRGEEAPRPEIAGMNTELHLGRVGHVVFNVIVPEAVIL